MKLGAIGQLKELGRRDPRNAEMWKGTVWKFEQKEIQRNMQTGEPVMRNVPVAFLGVDVSVRSQLGSVQPPSPATTQTMPMPASSAASTASNGATNGSAVDPILAGLSPAIQAAIKLAAKTKGHSEWVDAVLAVVTSR